MSDQTTLNRASDGATATCSERTPGSAESSRGKRQVMGDIVHDVSTMLELQGKLAALNGKASARRGSLAVAFGLVAAVMLLVGLNSAALAFSEWLVAYYELDRWVALTLSAASLCGIAILCGLVAWFRARASLVALKPSVDELAQNVRWIKRLLAARQIAEEAAEKSPNSTTHHTNTQH